jgi:putative flippase GtrA
MLGIGDISIEFGRLMRFGIVGVLASLVYAGVTFFIVESGIGKPVVATIVGQLCAALVSYFGHQRFSFAVASTHSTFVWRFIVIFGLTFAMNISITWLFTAKFGISPRVTIGVVTVLIPVTNFFCNRFWVFRPGLVQSRKAEGT